MDVPVNTLIFVILTCSFWDTEGRHPHSFIVVKNGGDLGDWGPIELCPEGFADGFSLKLQKPQGTEPHEDDTALNGIRLHCTNGATVESTSGPWGDWDEFQYCHQDHLVAFALSVEPSTEEVDNTAVNNVYFKCENGREMFGDGIYWSNYAGVSTCFAGAICGLQTRVQSDQGEGDDTALNDVKFFCC